MHLRRDGASRPPSCATAAFMARLGHAGRSAFLGRCLASGARGPRLSQTSVEGHFTVSLSWSPEKEVIEVPGDGHVVVGDVGNVHGDRPGGESGSIGRLGHAGVTSRMSHDRAPTRRLSCRALPPQRVAILVIAPLTAAKFERHSFVLLAEHVLPRRSNRRFPNPLGEWLKKHA